MRDADWTNAQGVRILKDALGDQADLYEPHLWRPAGEIDVDHLRLILTWPLVLAPSPSERDGQRQERMKVFIKSLSASADWEEENDFMKHAPFDPNITPWRSAERTRSEASNTKDENANGAGGTEKIKKYVDLEAEDDAQSYAEFVYFYEFIQRNIFQNHTSQKNNETPHVLHMFRRKNIKSVRFALSGATDPKSSIVHVADVIRFNLYSLDVGVVIVCVELSFGYNVKRELPEQHAVRRHSLTLKQTQSIIDGIRRVYTPYFSTDPWCDEYEQMPRCVPFVWNWLDESGKPISMIVPGAPCETAADKTTSPSKATSRFVPTGMKEALQIVQQQPRNAAEGGRTPPVADHWRAALAPLVFSGYADEKSNVVFRQILDERVPVLSFISVSSATKSNKDGTYNSAVSTHQDIQSISRGDWIRLCFADGPGNYTLPYAPVFLKDFESKHCYDRFYPSPSHIGSVRYMACGYHMSIVGAGGFFDETLIHHFRRHYFQMVLLANIEFAALLATSSRISAAIDALSKSTDRQEGKRRFGKSLELIEEDFLEFVHRYRFTGVSNQIQPTELFELLRKNMRLNGLFEDVKAEIEAAVTFNTGVAQYGIARSTYNLTEVATVAATLGIGFTFLSITEVGELLQAINPFAGGELKERLAAAFGSVANSGAAPPGATGTATSSAAPGVAAPAGANARGFIPMLAFVLAGVVYVACWFAMRILGPSVEANDRGRFSIRAWLPRLKSTSGAVVVGMFILSMFVMMSYARP